MHSFPWRQWLLHLRARWARPRAWLMLGGLAIAGSAVAAPVPASWLAYAQQVGEVLGQRLADAEAAQAGDLPPRTQATTLALSVWIAADGRISALRLDTPGDRRADTEAALRAVLQREPLPAAPPADMRQPLRLSLSLQPPAAAPAQ